MHRITHYGCIGLLVLITLGAEAKTISIDTDYGIRGYYHYCRYDNGKVYSFDASKTCPETMNEPTSTGGKGMGTLLRINNEGTTKACIYNVGGEQRSFSIDNLATCPLQHPFR